MEKEYWGSKFYSSKLNTVLLLVLIILMVFAIKIMLKDKEAYFPVFEKNEQVVLKDNPIPKGDILLESKNNLSEFKQGNITISYDSSLLSKGYADSSSVILVDRFGYDQWQFDFYDKTVDLSNKEINEEFVFDPQNEGTYIVKHREIKNGNIVYNLNGAGYHDFYTYITNTKGTSGVLVRLNDGYVGANDYNKIYPKGFTAVPFNSDYVTFNY